jgi:phage shock protein PspC (stress-responsive transcriptional regulator)
MKNSSRLYRSHRDKIIGGVSGGLANYFNVDVALIRVAFVLLLLFGGGGFLAYVILWIAIPLEPMDFINAGNTQEDEGKLNEESTENGKNNEHKKNNTSLIAGIILISIGLIILFDRIMPYYNIIDFWPLVLIVVGVLMIKPEIFKFAESQKKDSNKYISTSKEEKE